MPPPPCEWQPLQFHCSNSRLPSEMSYAFFSAELTTSMSGLGTPGCKVSCATAAYAGGDDDWESKRRSSRSHPVAAAIPIMTATAVRSRACFGSSLEFMVPAIIGPPGLGVGLRHSSTRTVLRSAAEHRRRGAGCRSTSDDAREWRSAYREARDLR